MTNDVMYLFVNLNFFIYNFFRNIYQHSIHITLKLRRDIFSQYQHLKALIRNTLELFLFLDRKSQVQLMEGSWIDDRPR